MKFKEKDCMHIHKQGLSECPLIHTEVMDCVQDTVASTNTYILCEAWGGEQADQYNTEVSHPGLKATTCLPPALKLKKAFSSLCFLHPPLCLLLSPEPQACWEKWRITTSPSASAVTTVLGVSSSVGLGMSGGCVDGDNSQLLQRAARPCTHHLIYILINFIVAVT